MAFKNVMSKRIGPLSKTGNFSESISFISMVLNDVFEAVAIQRLQFCSSFQDILDYEELETV